MGCNNSKSHSNKEQNAKNGKNKQNGLTLQVNDGDIQDSTIFKAQTPPSRKYEAPNKKEEGETASRDNLKQYYKLGKIQGIGSFGQVRIATSKQEESRSFAIKTIAKGRMSEKAYMLRRELEILKTLDHPNVIKFYEIFHDEEFIYFVMEYCNGGDLYNQITNNRKYFTEQEAANILFKVFCALAHMHSKDVIHRDLKPENLLFASKEEDSELKIIDFGLSRIFQPKLLKDVPSVVGTPLYVAPEVIEETYYGKECDNWSIGVVTYYILCGKEPFYGKNIGEVYKKIRTADFSFQGDPWPTISDEAKDLISKLLVVDPKQRMSAKQALSHPWFKKMVKHRDPNKMELAKHQYFIQNILENYAFKQIFKLKKEVVKILINHYLTDKEIHTLQKTFRLIDLDKNGELSFSEMKHVMETIGYKKEEINNMRTAFVQIRQTNQYQSKKEDIQNQSDEKLVIYESEFMRAALNLKKYLTKENLEGLFKFFAKSEEDKIVLEDIKDVIAREGRKLQEQELEDMMAEVSMEKRGSISFDLFKLMMQEDDIAKVQLSSITMQKVKTTNKKSLFKH